MNKVNFFHYTVVGTGPFPEDMLRYDACWPKDGSLGNGRWNERREVRLTGIKEPTIGRWLSFGWAVNPFTIDIVR
jgi:hypothetical protein